jgi:hypothetical protein
MYAYQFLEERLFILCGYIVMKLIVQKKVMLTSFIIHINEVPFHNILHLALSHMQYRFVKIKFLDEKQSKHHLPQSV